MLCRETRAGKLEATLAGGADCGRMTGKHFVSNQRPMSPERPVWVRSRVGVFTTAYRRGPEVWFWEVTWTCSRQIGLVPSGSGDVEVGGERGPRSVLGSRLVGRFC